MGRADIPMLMAQPFGFIHDEQINVFESHSGRPSEFAEGLEMLVNAIRDSDGKICNILLDLSWCGEDSGVKNTVRFLAEEA